MPAMRLQRLSGTGPLVRALPGVVVRSRWRRAGRQVLLQVVEPEGEVGAVIQRGGRMDEGIREQLAAFLHKQAALDGVAQHLLEQVHVLALRLAVPWLQQRKVGEQQRNGLLFWLLLPLTDDGWRRRDKGSVTD